MYPHGLTMLFEPTVVERAISKDSRFLRINPELLPSSCVTWGSPLTSLVTPLVHLKSKLLA